MEKNPMEKRQIESVKDRVARYFIETDIDTHSFVFDSYNEAKAKVDEINTSYEGIAFVAKEDDKFAVKFRTLHLGEGVEEYVEEGKDLEQAA